MYFYIECESDLWIAVSALIIKYNLMNILNIKVFLAFFTGAYNVDPPQLIHDHLFIEPFSLPATPLLRIDFVHF